MGVWEYGSVGLTMKPLFYENYNLMQTHASRLIKDCRKDLNKKSVPRMGRNFKAGQ
jgi:hypothetical protein